MTSIKDKLHQIHLPRPHEKAPSAPAPKDGVAKVEHKAKDAVAKTEHKAKVEGHEPKVPKFSADGMGKALKGHTGKTGQAASVLGRLKHDPKGAMKGGLHKTGEAVHKANSKVKHSKAGEAVHKAGSSIKNSKAYKYLENSKVNKFIENNKGMKGGKIGLGGAGAGVGLANGIKDMVDGAKSHDKHKIAGGAVSTASALLGGTAAAIEAKAALGKLGKKEKDSLAKLDKTLKDVGAGKGAEGAGKAAKAGAEGAKVAGKGAARFVPGLNVGVAVLDTANAIRTLKDPKASLSSKITSGITALGSITAATNVPILSQAGAAVSAISGITGAGFSFAGK